MGLNLCRHGLIDGRSQRSLCVFLPRVLLAHIVPGCLTQAFAEGRIAGAALDVFELEPLPRHDLLTTLPGVVLTGHIAGFSEGAIAGVVKAVVTSLIDLAEGRPPAGCVNPEVLNR